MFRSGKSGFGGLNFSRKGDLTISFSWVFMIIVGVVFIFLAYTIVQKYFEVEEAKYEIQVKGALRSVFMTVGKDDGITSSSLVALEGIFKEKAVNVVCEDGFALLSIDGKLDANNDYLKNFPVFMTGFEEEKVSFSYLAVESFKAPFKVNNLMAVVSKKNLIVFDKGSVSAMKIAKKFERSSGAYVELNYVVKDFVTELSSLEGEFEKQGLSSVMFVTDSTRKGRVSKYPKFVSNSYVVAIDWIANSVNVGEIIYSVVKEGGALSSSSKFGFVDIDESLSLPTMAIFSSPEVFGCAVQKIESQVSSIYDFYISKAQTFSESSVSLCTGISVSEQKTMYLGLKRALESAKSAGIEFKANSEGFYSKINDVVKMQQELEEFDCAFVY